MNDKYIYEFDELKKALALDTDNSITNDRCRLCTFFNSEYCYHYHDPTKCKDWEFTRFPRILLTDSEEMKRHVTELHRRYLYEESLKKGGV